MQPPADSGHAGEAGRRRSHTAPIKACSVGVERGGGDAESLSSGFVAFAPPLPSCGSVERSWTSGLGQLAARCAAVLLPGSLF